MQSLVPLGRPGPCLETQASSADGCWASSQPWRASPPPHLTLPSWEISLLWQRKDSTEVTDSQRALCTVPPAVLAPAPPGSDHWPILQTGFSSQTMQHDRCSPGRRRHRHTHLLAPGSFPVRAREASLWRGEGDRNALSQPCRGLVVSEGGAEGFVCLMEGLPRAGPGSHFPSPEPPLWGLNPIAMLQPHRAGAWRWG